MNTRNRLAYTLLTFALLSGASAEPEKGQSQEQVLFGFDDTALPLQQGMRMQLIPYRTPLGDDCLPMERNGTGVAVAWKGGSSLSTLQEREVQVELTGARTKLYSFRFE